MGRKKRSIVSKSMTYPERQDAKKVDTELEKVNRAKIERLKKLSEKELTNYVDDILDRASGLSNDLISKILK